MRTYRNYINKSGFKNLYRTKILIVGLLIVFQVANAKKNEMTAVFKIDSISFSQTGNEMIFLYRLSSSEIKVFSEASENYYETEVEIPLSQENWKIEDGVPEEKYFESICDREKETELQLEEWMTDDQHWRMDR
nr:hypothetical protein [Sunxiuqinia sp.]